MRSIAPGRNTTLSQVMSPSSLTTSTTQRLLQRSSRMNPATKRRSPRTGVTRNLDDEIVGKAPSSPLFIQEREEPADRRQAYHSYEESLLPAQSFFAHTSTERPVFEPCSLSSCSREKPSREMEKLKNQDSP